MKLKIKYLSLLFPCISLPLIAGNKEKEQRPNIVVIIADDLGTNELSCYGGRNLVTDNIDKLAAEGIRLTNNYASCAMSVPTRASMYTGLYPAKHGSYQNHKMSYSGIKSITSYLPQAGYRVGRTGKQHTSPQSVYQFEEIPGFQVNCVSTDASYTTDGIREFMTRKDSRPFCLFVCSINPHAPWTWGNPDEFDPDKVDLPPNCVDNPVTRKMFCKYLAEIRALDNEVGSVREVLEETGLIDNTLIIFLGEQGPQFPFAKWTCYNYGQHSAFIARYPDKIAAGVISNAIVQYEDILPTLMEFAGGDKIKGIDGNSFLQVLYGKKTEHRSYAYGIHNNYPEGFPYPIRSIRDKQYKLILNLTPEADYYEKHMMNVKDKNSVWVSWLKSAEQNESAKYTVKRFVKRPAVELYNLINDPWELNNLANDTQYAKKIAKMKSKLEEWMKEQGDTGNNMDVPSENKYF